MSKTGGFAFSPNDAGLGQALLGVPNWRKHPGPTKHIVAVDTRSDGMCVTVRVFFDPVSAPKDSKAVGGEVPTALPSSPIRAVPPSLTQHRQGFLRSTTAAPIGSFGIHLYCATVVPRAGRVKR
jgi:hypothetical protein